MQLESLTCNNCGASLKVPHAANFVTCASCGSQLAVKRTESVAYTEVLTRLDKRTAQMETELRRLKMANDLNQIDDDWQSEREQYLIRDKNGSTSEPTVEGAMLQGGLIAGIGGLGTCVVAGMSGASDMGSITLLLVVVFGGLGLATGGYIWWKARNYKQAYSDYMSRREAVYSRYKVSGVERVSGSWRALDEPDETRQLENW